ncbi:UNVERIFIED_ORG: hypothetical protein ABIB52_003750 [Arthrobacter sp. UYCu721]
MRAKRCLLGTFVPLFQGPPLGAFEPTLCQELGLVHLLGSLHELGILEVGVTGAVDGSGGLLPQLVNVGTVDPVLADQEQTFLKVRYCSGMDCTYKGLPVPASGV